jgi:uncharacterized protein
MIAVDTNILVYAHRAEFSQHERALKRLSDLAQGAALWGVPVFCLAEFVRIVTHPRILMQPFTPDEAVTTLGNLLESPSLSVLHPGERFWPLLQEAIREGRAGGNLALDAQIVALCREHGVRALLTEDRDFRRFRGFAVEGLG